MSSQSDEQDVNLKDIVGLKLNEQKSIEKLKEELLKMPELALRCSYYFHTLSQYCLTCYTHYKAQHQKQKIKLIKKNQRSQIKKHRHRNNDGNAGDDQDSKLEPPKKPLTAYIIYFQDKKQNFVERYPTLNLSDMTKLIAKEWKELTDDEKKPYLNRASNDRKRYDEQLIQYRQKYDFGFENRQPSNQKEKSHNDMSQEDSQERPKVNKSDQNDDINPKSENNQLQEIDSDQIDENDQ